MMVEKLLKKQSKLTYNGLQKSFSNYDSLTLKPNEMLIDTHTYLGFAVLE